VYLDFELAFSFACHKDLRLDVESGGGGKEVSLGWVGLKFGAEALLLAYYKYA
jgi:hypothetical protein